MTVHTSGIDARRLPVVFDLATAAGLLDAGRTSACELIRIADDRRPAMGSGGDIGQGGRSAQLPGQLVREGVRGAASLAQMPRQSCPSAAWSSGSRAACHQTASLALTPGRRGRFARPRSDPLVPVEDVMDKLLLTPVEAATVLGIGRSKLYELLQSGQLASVRIGTCRRVPAEAVHSFLLTLRSTASS